MVTQPVTWSSSTAIVAVERWSRTRQNVASVTFSEGKLYFLRPPRITSNAPEISASALPAEAGLISGTSTEAKATLPTPINSKMPPTSLTCESSYWTTVMRKSIRHDGCVHDIPTRN
jgi:hypothetical protein